MKSEQLKQARLNTGMKQVEASRRLGVSQAYLSQLETGVRALPATLALKVAEVYNLRPTALPLTELPDTVDVDTDTVEKQLASLGYPGFAHVRSERRTNPTEVVFNAVVKRDLDVRLVEALPWVLASYTDLNWQWLRDRVKLRNQQNRLGYLVHLAKGFATGRMEHNVPQTLSSWGEELAEARLEREGTLCRDSMPERERQWVKEYRPEAARQWHMLTSITPEQLPYAV